MGGVRGRRLTQPVLAMAVACALATLATAVGGRATAQDGGGEITYPAAGGVVAGPNVLVAYEADLEGDGRVALVVDGAVEVAGGEALEPSGAVLLNVGNRAVVPGLDPGEHTVRLVLTDADDRPLAGGDGPEVTFTVLEPLPVAVQRGTCADAEDEAAFDLEDTGSGIGAQTGAVVAVAEDEDPTAGGDAESAAGGDAEDALPIGAVPALPVEVSDTIVEVGIRDLLAEPRTVTVFALGVEGVEDGVAAACGEIGGPVFAGLLRVGLREQNGSGVVGFATIFDQGDRTRIVVEVARGLSAGGTASGGAVPAVATSAPTLPPPTSPPQPPPPPPLPATATAPLATATVLPATATVPPATATLPPATETVVSSPTAASPTTPAATVESTETLPPLPTETLPPPLPTGTLPSIPTVSAPPASPPG